MRYAIIQATPSQEAATKNRKVQKMAVTRSFLKGMGLTDEQVSAIIEEHTNTINGLKDARDKYKADAEKLVEVQKELDGLKGDDWRQKYTDLKKTFDDYKTEIKKQETTSKIKAAYTDMLRAANVDEKRIDAILRVTDLDGMKIDENGKLENADKLKDDIKSEWGAFITTTTTKGSGAATPPKGAGAATGKTREEILAIKDDVQRQKAMAENRELFGIA